MKKLFLCLAGAAAALTLNAKVWRVNYDENAKADFKTIAAACATTLVSDGDTLYMEPGLHAGSNSDNTISRPLTIFGSGWGFKANEGAISSVATTTIASSLLIESSDIIVKGLHIAYDIVLGKNPTSYANPLQNIYVERCRMRSLINRVGTTSGTEYISNLTIRSNFLTGNVYLYYEYSYLLKDCIIENNIVQGKISLSATGEPDLYTIIRHNIVLGTLSLPYTKSGGVIACDNIFMNASAFNFKTTSSNIRLYNNVLAISQEQYDADQTSVSPVGYSNYADNIFAGATFVNTCTDSIAGIWFDDAMRYQVRSDSPAKNAATDGTDCGAFGGEHPFVLYGRPEGIPYIYDVEVPAYPTDNKLNISFKVAGQNE